MRMSLEHRDRDLTANEQRQLAEQPDIDPACHLCIQAWNELTTTRSIGMAAGPIPWDKIVLWCEFHGVDHENTMLISDVIRYVDNQRAEEAAAKHRLERLGKGPT